MTFVWNSFARIVVSALCLVVAAGAGHAKPAGSEPASTTITADRMTVRNQENKAIFEGSVVMTKGSLTVHSDTMVVTFKQQDAAGPARSGAQVQGRPSPPSDGVPPERGGGALPTMGSRSVSMIEATGRVRIEKDDGTATCQRAVYYGEDERIVLTGEPVAWQKGTRVTGQKITLYLAEDRSVVEGGSRVMIEPEEAQRR